MPSDEFDDIKRTLANHEKRLCDLEVLLKSKPKVEKKKLSVKEFILQKQPADDIQKTLVLGYYLEHYENVSPFNVKDLERLFRESKEIVPGNINDKVNKNIDKGFIMEAKEKKDKRKSWTLTATGERSVEEGLKQD